MSEFVICVCKKWNKSKLSLCLFVGVSAFFDRFGVILGHRFYYMQSTDIYFDNSALLGSMKT